MVQPPPPPPHNTDYCTTQMYNYYYQHYFSVTYNFKKIKSLTFLATCHCVFFILSNISRPSQKKYITEKIKINFVGFFTSRNFKINKNAGFKKYISTNIVKKFVWLARILLQASLAVGEKVGVQVVKYGRMFSRCFSSLCIG